MTEYRNGDVRLGARFVDDYGIGPGESWMSTANYEGLDLSKVELANALADVVAVAESLASQLAVATGEHERQIMDRMKR